MSRYIATRAIRGANALVMEAEAMLGKALREKGGETAVAFPNTAYYLPLIYGMTGAKVETLGDLRQALNHARELLHPVPSPKHWTPYLGETLDSGMATLIAAEVIEAVRFVYGLQPEPLPGFELAGGTAYGRNGNGAVGHLNGPIDDIQLRTWGIQLVDGRMPGFAAIVGCAKSNEVAVKLVRELQKRNILTFLSGNVNGRSIIHQLHEEGVTLGYDTYTVPFGTDTLSAIYALGFATRSALTFGGLKAGQARDILLYNRERVFAFVLALGEVDDLKYAAAAGAINFGFPVIADTVIPEILPTGVTQYEHVVSMPWNEIEGQDDLERAERLVQKCIEIRGVKIKLADVPVPVPYGSAFEGEVVRKNDMRVEFGGKNSRCFEYLTMAPMDEVVDGKIEVVGPDFSQIPDKGAMDMGIVVEVAGRKMQEDFEPVLERQIHYFINGASGIQHIGQRDIAWIRLAASAVEKGFTLEHFGKILHARFHADFGAIVDKVQVTIYTDPDPMNKWLEEAREAYNFRNQRLADLTDTAVNEFYSCTLCQSFAPDHVCIVSPERLGLCGAYNWLDCKASYSINPTGPNQPIKLGKLLDEEFGYWTGTLDYAKVGSHGAIEEVSMYSIMENPMTACLTGDVEVIVNNQAQPIGAVVEAASGAAPGAHLLTLNEAQKTAVSQLLGGHKNPAPGQLIRIKTKSGVTLTLTANHEVAVDRWGQNGHDPWVRADQLQVGDRVYALKQLRVHIDKTQEQLLPYKVGELLADLPASQTVLSKSTLFYYKTGRSRPTAGNVRRVIAEAPETAALLSAYLESDAFLDSITEIETIANQGDNRPYQHVYNLSLLDINSYLANGLHVKNCGCFECIVMYIPEVEGVMVVSREDIEMTPAGMKFSTLAGMAGGGVQTPGVMGVGKYYLLSPKFISADGGFKRTVWMSRNLKESMADELRAVAEREGIPDLIERIADSSKVTTVEALQEWVEEMNHPVLEMGSMVRAPRETTTPEATQDLESWVEDMAHPVLEMEAMAPAPPEKIMPEPAQAEKEMEPSTAVASTPGPQDLTPAGAVVTESKTRPKEMEIVVEPPATPKPEPVAVEEKPVFPTPADLLAEAQAAALRQAQALQQAAQEALRQAELLGQARAAQPASPAEAVDSLRQALQAALAALGSPPPPTPAPQPAAAAPVEPAPAAAPAPPAPEKAPEPVAAKAPEPKVEVKPAPPPIKKEAVKEQPWLPAGSKIPLPKEKWVGKVREVTLGATAEDGGTRSHTVTIGGETAMPFLQFEGQFPHPPVVALEVRSQKPADWSPLLQEAWGQAMDDPAQWAQAAEQANADLIYLTLTLDDTPETAVATVKSVLQATGLPLIVVGPGQAEKDNELIVPIAEATKGERLLLGICEDKNYRTIVAAAMANGHLVSARTAMDVNLAKQLNILISDMGMPLDRVVMDPTTGALGYGFEYGYSVMERLRLAALQGDGMTQLPMLVTPGEECWKTKEAKVGSGVPEEWGDWLERAVNWETITAVMLIESGANIVVLRHPTSAQRTRRAIAGLAER
jgi:acetyl-CoA synthase